MKKAIFFTFIVSVISLSAFAQLKVASDGNVGIGIGTSSPLSQLSIGTAGYSDCTLFAEGDRTGIYAKRSGTAPYSSTLVASKGFAPPTTNCYTYGIYGLSNATSAFGSGRAFGVLGKAGNSTSGYNYGVMGTTYGTQNGAGVVGTTNDNIDVNISGTYAGYFVGNMRTTAIIECQSLTQFSDMRYKQNIAGLESAIPAAKGINTLNTIIQMAPVEYNLKQQYQESKGDSATTNKPLYDENSQLFQKKHFGLVAQDLQKIYPELVYEDDNGYLSVNYTEIIPLLIQSIKELKAEVDGIKDSGETTKSAFSGTSAFSEENKMETAGLFQNNPNPFNSETTIRFNIPKSVQNAQLHILNMNGVLLKSLQINQRGTGDEIINGNEFIAGMYLYSLVCDGRIVDTKQMLLTE